MKNQMPRILKKLLRCIRRLLLLFLIVSIGGVLLLRFVDPPCTPLMLWRWAAGEGMRHEWRDLSGMAPALQQAVMAAEDQQFPDHFGFDWDQIEPGHEGEPEAKAAPGGKHHNHADVAQPVSVAGRRPCAQGA